MSKTSAGAEELAATAHTYENPLVPAAFDAVIGAIFLPFGGVRRLRSSALDLLAFQPGERVLEIGCGTGGVTGLLLERGLEVTSVDGSERMLARARRRAPGAEYHCLRLEAQPFDVLLGGRTFDAAVCAFVLHELPAALRADVLASIGRLLAPRGRLGILDHGVPQQPGFARLWRRMLLALEPATVRDCIEAGYERDLSRAGFRIEQATPLAAGTAQALVARRG